MVFEYADSGSLRHYLSASIELEWPTRCRLGIDIIDGLRYLHELDILHKDLVIIDVQKQYYYYMLEPSIIIDNFIIT